MWERKDFGVNQWWQCINPTCLKCSYSTKTKCRKFPHNLSSNRKNRALSLLFLFPSHMRSSGMSDFPTPCSQIPVSKAHIYILALSLQSTGAEKWGEKLSSASIWYLVSYAFISPNINGTGKPCQNVPASTWVVHPRTASLKGEVLAHDPLSAGSNEPNLQCLLFQKDPI